MRIAFAVATMTLAVLSPVSASVACTGDAECAANERCHGTAGCATGSCVPAFSLATFPIGQSGITPYNAALVAVLDHKSRFYQQCCDTEIVAYTGESVVRGAEVGLCPSEPLFPQCFVTPNCICEYKHPDSIPFTINGNYVGALFGPEYLSYDGHAGYDYGYGAGTSLVATASGNLCKAIEDPINGHVGALTAWDKFHTFYIDHGAIDGAGYASWYLHAQDLAGTGSGGEVLAELLPGECAPVGEGQVVATLGNFGTFLPHLHFEVRTYDLLEGTEGFSQKGFDPYGWTGTGTDPLATPGENPQAESRIAATWIACGNGRLECGEQCDDGNTLDGDCCSSSCQLESDGSICDDGDDCSGGETCLAGTCGGGSDVCLLDPFKCYKVKDLKDPKFERSAVTLSDQFGVNDGTFELVKPRYLCNPATVDGSAILQPAGHLTCYKLKGPKLDVADRPEIEVTDGFGTVRLQAKKPSVLCVPSTKTVLP